MNVAVLKLATGNTTWKLSQFYTQNLTHALTIFLQEIKGQQSKWNSVQFYAAGTATHLFNLSHVTKMLSLTFLLFK